MTEATINGWPCRWSGVVREKPDLHLVVHPSGLSPEACQAIELHATTSDLFTFRGRVLRDQVWYHCMCDLKLGVFRPGAKCLATFRSVGPIQLSPLV